MLAPVARAEFAGLGGAGLVRAVGEWVHDRLDYDVDATSPTGGAVETLDSGRGVCRDYAHLVAGLLRGLDVPTRVVSVYAGRRGRMEAGRRRPGPAPERSDPPRTAEVAAR